MGENKLTKDQLAELLKTPLDPNLDYYDATASIEAMANHIRDLHKLINYLFQSVALQGAAVLDIREKMGEHKTAIERAVDIALGADDEPHGLVGFDAPKIVVPN